VLIFCSEFPVGTSLPVTREILEVCSRAAKSGRVAALAQAGTCRGGFNPSNLLGALDRARLVEEEVSGPGRCGAGRGGGGGEERSRPVRGGRDEEKEARRRPWRVLR
jgi:hypothetical protein